MRFHGLFSWYLVRSLSLFVCHEEVVAMRCTSEAMTSELILNDTAKSAKLIGGSEAVSGSWPWQVRIGIRTPNGQIAWICGGSILSDIYILTAAHCLESGLNLKYVVRVGEHNAAVYNPGEEDYPVIRARIHEKYNKPSNFANDIAILRVGRRIYFGSHVAPACLPTTGEDPTPGTSCFVTGWGNTGPSGAPFSSVLKEGPVKIIARQLCQTGSFWGTGVKSTNLCAGYPQGRIDACRGDSGGPLVCKGAGDDAWILQGIVSFGWNRGCGFPGKPAVYTRVSNYINWIQSVTGSRT